MVIFLKLKARRGKKKKGKEGAYLMAQGLRFCLPLQGVQVLSLVGELRSYMPQGEKNKT